MKKLQILGNDNIYPGTKYCGYPGAKSWYFKNIQFGTKNENPEIAIIQNFVGDPIFHY